LGKFLNFIQATLILGVPAIYAACSAGHVSPEMCCIIMCLCWLGILAAAGLEIIKNKNWKEGKQ